MLLAACGSSAATGTGTSPTSAGDLAQYISKGVNIGMTLDAPYVTQQGSQVSGTEVELAHQILNKLGITKINDVLISSYGGLIPSLQASRTDLVVGLVISPVRCKVVDFSTPYLTTYPAWAVKKGNPDGLNTWADVKNKNVNVGILSGNFDVQNAAAAGVPSSNLQQYPDLNSGLTALQQGRIAAMSGDVISMQVGVQTANQSSAMDVVTEKDYVVQGSTVPGYTLGFSLRKDEGALLKAVNDQLATFMPAGGAAIGAKYGIPAAVYQAPRSLTTKQLCGA
jgi:polar amino acid transport system substrate-binding protein